MHIVTVRFDYRQENCKNACVVIHSTHRNADMQQSKQNVLLRKLQIATFIQCGA